MIPRVLFSILGMGAILLLGMAGCSRTEIPSETPQTEAPQTEAAGNPLDGTQWKLTGWSTSSIHPAEYEITVRFGEGRISGRSPLNSYAGACAPGPGNAFATGALATTKRAGPEPAMRAERTYFQLLEQAVSYKIHDGELKLLDAAGNELLIFTVEK